MKLVCNDCKISKSFVANSYFTSVVDEHCSEIEEMEMKEEPTYDCLECGSSNVKIQF